MRQSELDKALDGIGDTFYARLSPSELERARTVGDLFEIVRERSGCAREMDRLSERKKLVGHVRKALVEAIAEARGVDPSEISMRHELRSLIEPRELRFVLSHPVRDAVRGLNLPFPESGYSMWRPAAAIVLWGVMVAAFIAWTRPFQYGLAPGVGVAMMTVVWAIPPTLLINALALRLFPRPFVKRYPADVRTVGELVQLTLTMNFRELHNAVFQHHMEGPSTEAETRAVDRAFQRLRGALSETLDIGRERIRPETKLEEILPWRGRRAAWKKLGRKMQGDLPNESSSLGCLVIGGLGTLYLAAWPIVLCAIAAGGAALCGYPQSLEIGGRIVVWIAVGAVAMLALTACAACVTYLRDRVFPEGVHTVGALAERIATSIVDRESQASEAADGFLWAILRRRLAIDLGVPVEEVRRDRPIESM